MNRPGSIVLASVTLVIVLLACLQSTSGQEIDLSSVSLPTTPGDAGSLFYFRAGVITQYNACRETALGDMEGSELDFLTVAIAKLEQAKRGQGCPGAGSDALINTVNKALLDFDPNADSHKDWRLGSSVDNLGCHRKGEMDVAMGGLIIMMYRYPVALQTPLEGYPQTAYDHVLHDLLQHYISGPHQDLSWYKVCAIGVPFPETENHTLNIESARYLTNQLLRLNHSRDNSFDNEANGYTKLMLEYLKGFLQNDFSEYNSRPYQTLSLIALQNLYDFASGNVSIAAGMVLDYISAKFAVSSNGLRRFAPYRRRKSHYDTLLFDGHIGGGDYPQSDPQTFRFMILAGINTQPPALGSDFRGPEGESIMQLAAVSKYRVPDLILDLMINHDHASYYQRIHHVADEIYASSPKYLITAGGKWIPGTAAGRCVVDYFDYCGDEISGYEDVGMELPTTLMPTAEGTNVIRFIQIFSQPRGVNNCVAPGFACGQFLLVPQSYLAQNCFNIVDGSGTPSQSGPWFFIDASGKPPCVQKSLGLFIAAYGKAFTRPRGLPPRMVPEGPPIFIYQESDYLTEVSLLPKIDAGIGFFEVAPSDSMDFATFQKQVLSQNGSRSFEGQLSYEYVTVDGTKIVFAGGYTLPNVILSIGDRLESNENAKPLAQGDIINSDGHSGLITIDNHFTDQSLVLDMRDASNPRESETFSPPPDFPSLPPCGTRDPRFTPGFQQANSDWVGSGIWGDTGLDTQRDRIVVRISATQKPGVFHVSTLERSNEVGFRDVTTHVDAVGITASPMPDYKADRYAPRVSDSIDTNRREDNNRLHPPGPLSNGGGSSGGMSTDVPSRFFPSAILALPHHVTLQVALGCIPRKPTQGLYMRYFRSADDGQTLTDVMLVHSHEPPR